MTTALSALADVITERRRQIEKECWTPRHDDEHKYGELSAAAVCYAMWATNDMAAEETPLANPPAWWPWDLDWWKPTDTRRNLVKAAALILAEIERLDRCSAPQNASKQGEQP